jgi:hypothetical protein
LYREKSGNPGWLQPNGRKKWKRNLIPNLICQFPSFVFNRIFRFSRGSLMFRFYCRKQTFGKTKWWQL